MEELAAKQSELGKEIEKIHTNFKKDGKSRKNSEYLHTRLNRLEHCWSQFDAIDIQLQSYKENYPNHAYFIQEFYKQVGTSYEQLKDILEKAIEDIEKANLAQGDSRSSSKPLDESDQQKRVRCQRAHMSALEKLLVTTKDELLTPRSVTYCRTKLSALTSYWTEISAGHSKIMAEEIQFEYTPVEYSKLEQHYLEVAIKLQEIMEQQSPSMPVPTIPNNASVTLPKIAIPIFNGNYLNWPQFKDLFLELIHNQPIGKVQKMMYLKSNLTGEANKLIQHLSVCADNYEVAWNTLQARYNNKRLLVTAFIDRLLGQQNIQTEAAAPIKYLHDTTKECLLGLENIGVSIQDWSPILHHLIVKKLDRNTHNLYEQSLQSPRSLQDINNLLNFLELRFQALETLGNTGRNQAISNPSNRNQKPTSYKTSSFTAAKANSKKTACLMCKGNHSVVMCDKFRQLPPAHRLKHARSWKLCLNCLREGHNSSSCSLRHCLKCSEKHNTLLHVDTNSPEVTTNNANNTNLAAATMRSSRMSHVFLATAIINLEDSYGDMIDTRALLDSGSQLNFITEKLCKKLNLNYKREDINIAGIGRSKTKGYGRINLTIRSRNTGYTARIEAFILPLIASPQPEHPIMIDSWNIPQNIKLADPHFNLPQSIDLLIGAELYAQIMSIGQISLGNDLPTLQNTTLGWVVLGKARNTTISTPVCGISHRLENQIERFFSLEEDFPPQKALTTDEMLCEEFFKNTTTRDEQGRFIVRLPFSHNPECLGESRDVATQRFFGLERRLMKNPTLKCDYAAFIREYIDLGHMEPINNAEIPAQHYFLPHHCVLKPDSSTTKLRVVFDASAKTTTNISLNNILRNGPVLQEDLFSILLRFRTHKYVFTADIAKMYRQIKVANEDANFQLIVWRDNPQEKLSYYRLRTVTYGTTSASYLATKCLQSLADIETSRYPLAAAATKRDFYMDDIMTGSDNLKEAEVLQTQLIQMLQSAGFKLRKWCANNPRLLKSIPKEDQEIQLDISENEENINTVKTLGLIWNPKADEFTLKGSWEPPTKITKRTILSDISRLFDPLGFVNPVIVLAKIIMQELWELKIDWDAALPQGLHMKWNIFRNELSKLNTIRIPRLVLPLANRVSIQIHGFSDASEKAFGACVYLRAVDQSGKIISHLLCAKSRVAPIKKQTLARLELCAAKLLVQLTKRTKEALRINVDRTFYWTDSMIVLAWIAASTSSSQTFIANRVAEIQRLSTRTEWRHVESKKNPADLVSRGMLPGPLMESFWFNGPDFLQLPENQWPQITPPTQEILTEERTVTLVTTGTATEKHFIYIMNHRNSFKFLKRTTAFIMRFVKNCKVPPENRNLNPELDVVELYESEMLIVKQMQSEAFAKEIKHLKSKGAVHSSSQLSNLAPFLDKENVIRVGGRLQKSKLAFENKHQALLPYSNPLTKLLMNDIHCNHLHAGPQALLSITRQRFWPLKGKRIAQAILRQCIRCARAKPQMISQLMGNLPAERVQPSRPFVHVGVDFCGPIYIHYKIRGKQPTKAYIAVFVCFAVKATHLEVVSDLTTAAFIGALKRFIARRGRPAKIFCDNATNFIGAHAELEDLHELFMNEQHQNAVKQCCTNEGIQWCHIPPRSPHFGGIWESAVKSAKHHLKRIVQGANLTYEELCTVMADIEAVLNSRPLTPLSSDPNDPQALTPGHFLIGAPLTSIIEPSLPINKEKNLAHWNRVKAIQHEFWRRWSSEYLQELQNRYKWKRPLKDIEKGTVVLLKEDNLPPLKWRMGVVIGTRKGPDGLRRVADIKTSTGECQRSVHRISPLPLNTEEDTTTKPDKNAADDTQNHPKTRSACKRPAHPLKGRFLPISRPPLEPPNPDHQPKRTKTSKVSLPKAMLTLLLIAFLPNLAKGNNSSNSFTDMASITENRGNDYTLIYPKTGIYIEQVGITRIKRGTFRIELTFPGSYIARDKEGVNKIVEQMTKICKTSKKISQETHCDTIIHHLRERQAEILKDMEIINSLQALERSEEY